MQGPLAGLLPGLNDTSFTVLLATMVVGWAVVVGLGERVGRSGSSSGPGDRTLAAVSTGLVILFGLAPVVLSSDLFGYLAYARLDVIHGLDPYSAVPAAAPHDASVPLVYWQHATSPYGPLFTLLTLPLAHVGIAAATWALKSLETAAALAAAALTWRLALRHGRRPGVAVALVTGNPLVLLYAIGGGHNEMLVGVAVLAGLLLLTRERPRWAGGAFGLALGLKATGGLLLPFAVVSAPSRAGARRILVGAAVSIAAISVVALATFGSHLLDGIGRVATGQPFVAPWSGPDALGRLLGTGVTSGVRATCFALAGAVYLGCLARAGRRRGDRADPWGDATLGVLAVTLAVPSLVPWYACWALPAAAIARGRAARSAVVGVTALIALTKLPGLGFEPF